MKANPAAALDHIQAAFEELREGKVPRKDLVFTRLLKREYKKDTIMQLQVARKIEARRPGYGPKPGTRVPFVILEGADIVSRRAEDPSFAWENGKPIDYHHYIQNLRPSVESLFAALGEDLHHRCMDYFDDAQAETRRQQMGMQSLRDFFKGEEEKRKPVRRHRPSRKRASHLAHEQPTLLQFFQKNAKRARASK